MSDNKKQQLRKHKAIATGLFLFMAFLYLLMVFLSRKMEASWIGYVEAFSEAAMVGALADWFAVTALFRYPFGIKIPHTNLIENKKNDIGENLGYFVQDNFLTPKNIRPYIEKLDVVSIVSNWLNKPNNQLILSEELGQFIKKIVSDLNQDEVAQFIANKASGVLQDIDYNSLLSKGIEYLLQNKEEQRLIDNLIPKIKKYVENSQDLLREKISEHRPFIAFLAGKKISKEFTVGIIAFLDEIEEDQNHYVRKKISESLEEFSLNVYNDPDWKDKIANLKKSLITSDQILPYATEAWESLKENLLENLQNKHSTFYLYLNKNIEKIANDLSHDENLQTRINGWIRLFIFRMILRNSKEVEKLISNTVNNWEGKELSEKLELEVGKDLQFIRINGTLVGGLVGLIIYIVTKLLFG